MKLAKVFCLLLGTLAFACFAAESPQSDDARASGEAPACASRALVRLSMTVGVPFSQQFRYTMKESDKGPYPAIMVFDGLPPGLTSGDTTIEGNDIVCTVSGTPVTSAPGRLSISVYVPYGDEGTAFNSIVNNWYVYTVQTPTAVLPGNGTITASLADSCSKGYNDGWDPEEYGNSSLSIAATLTLGAIADLSTINETTPFSIVAGRYTYATTLGAAASLGGKLDLSKHTATFVDQVSIDQCDMPDPDFKTFKYGSVSLKWDPAKKILKVKAQRKIKEGNWSDTGDIEPGDFFAGCNILCKAHDEGPYTADNAKVLVQIQFGEAHSFVVVPMTGKAKTTDTSNPPISICGYTDASAKGKKTTGDGTGTPAYNAP